MLREEGGLNSGLYFGHVMHHRLRPKRHRFVYRVCSFLLDLDEIPALAKTSKLFSHNRSGLFSFRDRDFGPGEDRPLKPWLQGVLSEHGYAQELARAELLCFPRLFGYVFNPLSVYFCYDPEDRLFAILYEVTNTFRERHSYLLPALLSSGEGSNRSIRHNAPKKHYVSPFIGMDAHYSFRVNAPGDRVLVSINEREGGLPLLYTSFAGRRARFGDSALGKTALAYPLMSLKVMAAIHWEAFRLWRKGAPVFRRLSPPETSITTG